MMSWTGFCQTTSEYKKVKRTTLVNIKKKVEKCDSLAVRYEEKSLALDELIESNEKTSVLLMDERTKIKRYEEQISDLEKNLKTKKNNKLIIGISAGTAVGIVVGVLISK